MTPQIALLRELRVSDPDRLIDGIKALTVPERNMLVYQWELWARDKQLLPEGDWDTWLIKAGRGFGKTRTGAETVRLWARTNGIIHMVAPTASDARDVMVEGESGILAISPKYERPVYSSSNRRLTWPNGSKGILFSADEPDRLRGPQCHKAWADELAAWRYPDAWDQLQFGLRLGNHPQCVITTTPRPTPIIKSLCEDARTVVTSGSTYENKSNLAPSFLTSIERKYEGTRLGRQEIYAEVLNDLEGALWNYDIIGYVKALPDLMRVVVAIDPAVTSKDESDETGIIVAGIGYDGYLYVIEDCSGRYTPNDMGHRVIRLLGKYGADRVVAEVNNGGDMIEAILRGIDENIPYRAVHATQGKRTRAEPVAALYEQRRVKHLGTLAGLESQMTSWDARSEKSPDRVDALVWAITELTGKRKNIIAV